MHICKKTLKLKNLGFAPEMYNFFISSFRRVHRQLSKFNPETLKFFNIPLQKPPSESWNSQIFTWNIPKTAIWQRDKQKVTKHAHAQLEVCICSSGSMHMLNWSVYMLTWKCARAQLKREAEKKLFPNFFFDTWMWLTVCYKSVQSSFLIHGSA